ncbi:hypothetical protein [Aquirhabdus parva]|uniref:Uncharacterized protein n=1 Tax=Aquirhabdus parva TaxID=2283318 RepID=A0A345P852_9GAMM|nr:hypothetical protein [Aquirhabdus parva]AXI03461.1 hypothetical protein HYN46_11790 [Aquirhabdus parva]
MKFISLRVKTALLVHGYTEDHKEITEIVNDESFVEKLIAVDRIQSVTEKYLLVSSSHGRIMYWEYEGSLASVTERLNRAGLVIQ